MISHLKGIVAENNLSNLVISINGVGFLVYIPTNVLANKGQEISLWTYLVVREDALDLYGFSSKEDRDFFKLLIGVSGVGPKTAIGILSFSSVEALRKSISSGSTEYLTKVSGVGKKIAQKISLELKDKVGFTDGDSSGMPGDDIDVIEALKSLGYSREEVRDILSKIDPKITKTGDRVKEALKKLNK